MEAPSPSPGQGQLIHQGRRCWACDMESHIQGQVWRSQEVQPTDIRQGCWVMAGDYKCPACIFPGPQGLDAENHEITGITDNKQDLFWFFSLPYTTAEKLRTRTGGSLSYSIFGLTALGIQCLPLRTPAGALCRAFWEASHLPLTGTSGTQPADSSSCLVCTMGLWG